jgi:hypothetical protein
LMQNREALEAITQVQEGKTKHEQSLDLRVHLGLQRLQTVAPNLFQGSVLSFVVRSTNISSLDFRGAAGLPMGLRFGPTGLIPPAAPATATAPTPADANNYSGVFAQMLNMMSNQNLVGSLAHTP